MQKSENKSFKKPVRFNRPGESNYKPKGMTVYVGNLNYKVTKKDLFGIFAKFGKVKTVNLQTQPGTDKSKGIAFVRMEKAKDGLKAIDYLNGREVDGRTLKASEANEGEFTKKPRKFKSSTKKTNFEMALEKKEIRAKKRNTGLNALKTFLDKK